MRMKSSCKRGATPISKETADKITVFVDGKGYTFDNKFYIRELSIKRPFVTPVTIMLQDHTVFHSRAPAAKRQMNELKLEFGNNMSGVGSESYGELLSVYLHRDTDVVCVDNDDIHAVLASLGFNVVHLHYGEQEWRLRRLYWPRSLTLTCTKHSAAASYVNTPCSYFVVQAMELACGKEIN